jgi:hypothetical protein
MKKLFSLLFSIVLLLTWSLSSSYASKLHTAHEKNFVLKKSDVVSFELSVLKMNDHLFMEPRDGSANWTGSKDAILNKGFTNELKFIYKDYDCSTLFALLKQRYQSYKSNINYKNISENFRS